MIIWILLCFISIIQCYQHVITPEVTFDPRDISFWKSLAPTLHIYDEDHFRQQRVFNRTIINRDLLLEQVLTEGYSQLSPLDWELPLQAMIDLIEDLYQMHIPITFCYLFDEFWYLFMRLHHSFEDILGQEYQRLPDFWAWRVDPKQQERGWRVHRDKNFDTLFSNGMPKSISVWIPLSDATTSNGCMYVLPADRDPTYRRIEALTEHWEDIAPDIRALPVSAGGALIWNQMVWHWGSHSNKRGQAPRYSLAVEFQALPTSPSPLPGENQFESVKSDEIDITPTGSHTIIEENLSVEDPLHGYQDSDIYGDTVPYYNLPLSNPLLLLSFETRLLLIAKQILQYQHMYPLSDDVALLATKLIEELQF